MAAVIPQFADNTRIQQDIDETGTTNPVILEKITRANEDASMQMGDLFLNNVDVTVPVASLPDWFVQITTQYATALFWVKSTGTAQAVQQAEEVYAKAEKILLQRFQPVGSRLT
ncbi:MAG: hypothetical protein ACR2P9_08725 [Gammaproteobacteria bacterium]